MIGEWLPAGPSLLRTVEDPNCSLDTRRLGRRSSLCGDGRFESTIKDLAFGSHVGLQQSGAMISATPLREQASSRNTPPPLFEFEQQPPEGRRAEGAAQTGGTCMQDHEDAQYD